MTGRLEDLLKIRSQSVETYIQLCDRVLTLPAVKKCKRFGLELEAVHGGRKKALSRVIEQTTRITLHGPPGSGKTVFLLKLLERFASSLREKLIAREPLPDRTAVPVYLEVGRASGSGTRLPELVALPLGAHGDPVGIVARVLCRFDVVLLIDGLNELPKAERRATLNDLVNFVDALDVRRLSHALRVVLTTRTYSMEEELAYLERLGFTLAEVVALDGERVEREIARGLRLSRVQARLIIGELGPQLRPLLATAQNLDYLVQWCRSKRKQGQYLATALRTRGALLDHFFQLRLQRVSHPERLALLTTLEGLAYALHDGLIFFSRASVVKAGRDSAARCGLTDHIPVVNLLFDLGLLVDEDGVCRFDHHSHQQFFLARRMAARPDDLDHYLRDDVWHEPLVIMAGLIDRPDLMTLLKRAEFNRPLYAYLLANSDLPEVRRMFLLQTVETFTAATRQVAVGLVRLLGTSAALWFVLLMFVGLGIAVFEEPVRSLLVFYGIAHFPALPLLLRWHRRRLRTSLLTLRNTNLPELLAVVRPFRERGALEMVRSELEGTDRILRRRQYSDADPRVQFVRHALKVVTEALETAISLSEDEILAQLNDPLIAQVLEPARLSAKGVRTLCEQALSATDVPTQESALRLMKRVWLAREEFRNDIASTLLRLTTDEHKPRSIRRQADQVCRQLRLGRAVSAQRHATFSRLARLWLGSGD